MKQLIGALMALLMALTGAQPSPVGSDAALTRFSYSHSGMSADRIYAYSVYEQDGRMLADFELYCRYEVRGVELDAADVAALAEMIDDCGLWSWNGFGESNPDVLDGERFSMYAMFADGRELSAWGSNAYPDGYRTGAQAICAFFETLMEKYGIDPERMDA